MEVDEELFSDPLEEEDNSCDEIKDVNKDTQFPVHHTATSCFPMETATFFTSTYPSSSHCQLHLGKAYTMCCLRV